MKDRGVLHPALSWTLAETGHGDRIALADAGLPVPPATPRIDLAFAPGRPALLEVLDAVLTEFRPYDNVLLQSGVEFPGWIAGEV